MQSILIVLNQNPYDGTDVTYNALRLAKQLKSDNHPVRLFLQNDSVDLARDACKVPPEYDQDLVQMLKELIKEGCIVKVCGSCMARCGIFKDQPYFEGAEKSTMAQLADWIVTSDKVISF